LSFVALYSQLSLAQTMAAGCTAGVGGALSVPATAGTLVVTYMCRTCGHRWDVAESRADTLPPALGT